MANLPLSIVMACLAYGLLSFGQVLQKKAATELPSIEKTLAKDNAKNFLKSPKWLIGFMIGNFQIVFLWIAMANGPLSLVTPMAGIGIIVLLWGSLSYLHEKINFPMLVGIILTITGMIIIGVSSTGTEPVYNWSESLQILISPTSIVILIILLGGAIGSAGLGFALKFRYADILFGIAGGFAISFSSLFFKMMVAGLNEGISNLTFIDIVLVLFFVVLLVGGNFSSMVFQQYGYQKGKAIVITPIVSVISIVLPTLAGIFMFNEWANYNPLIILLKVIAMSFLVLGVIFLSIFNAKMQ